jgi:regulator of sigma E protease
MHPLTKFGLTVLLLASLVFVHELGHFLVAKLFRVRVLRFSLGFGPRLLAFTWGETEYCLSLIPFGGYVKMSGDDPTEERSGPDRDRGFLEQSPLRRGLIAIAGPAMNFIFPVLVYFLAFYFKGTELSSRLGRVDPDRPAYAAGLRPGDRIVAVDGHPVRYFSELRDLIGRVWDRSVLIAYERNGKVDTVEVIPSRTEEQGVLETEVRGIIGVAPFAPAPVIGITHGSEAHAVGLRTFDRVVSVGGSKVSTYPDLERHLLLADGRLNATVVRDVPTGGASGALTTYEVVKVTLDREACATPLCGIEPAELYAFSVRPATPAFDAGLRRGDRLVAADGTPLITWGSFERLRQRAGEKPFVLVFLHEGARFEKTVVQRKVVREDELGNRQTVLEMGAERDERSTSFVEGERIAFTISVGEAFVRSLREVPQAARKIGLALARMVFGDISFKSVGGPIMMYDIASRSAEAGFEYYLEVMALISINIGVVNLLPIPILDGFLILSAAWETIRRRPISLRARLVANYIGLAFLLGLMALVMKNDITRFLLN